MNSVDSFVVSWIRTRTSQVQTCNLTSPMQMSGCAQTSTRCRTLLNSIVNVPYGPYVTIQYPILSGSGRIVKIPIQYIPTLVCNRRIACNDTKNQDISNHLGLLFQHTAQGNIIKAKVLR